MLHHRAGSGSTRIAIPPSPNLSSSQGFPKHDRDKDKDGGSSYRLSKGKGRQTRLSIRHLGLLAVASLALYVLVFRSNSYFTSSSPRTNAVDNNAKAASKAGKTVSKAKGVVDRTVMDKLRALEQAAGLQDEDEVEAREADRLPYSHRPDAPPPIRDIPKGKPKLAGSPDVVAQGAGATSPKQLAEHQRQATLLAPSELDSQYCPEQAGGGGNVGCKFLLPAWIGEQETKAQMHLYQLGLLALALNRTLVLPNVSKSRMTSCASRPFEFYYAPHSLAQLGIPTIPYARFAEWSGRRAPPPSAQIVSVTGPKPDLPKGAVQIDTVGHPALVPGVPKRKLCLEPPRTFLEFSSFSSLAVHPPTAWSKTAEARTTFGESLVKTLASGDVLARSVRTPSSSQLIQPGVFTPDVLVFNYELRHPIISHTQIQDLLDSRVSPNLESLGPAGLPTRSRLQPFSHFPYSAIWSEVAQQVLANLSPFVAVHWRQETLPPSIIAPCGDALVDALVRLVTVEHPAIRTVYLATDYPVEDLMSGKEGVTAHSGTFGKLLTEEHHKGMERFLSQFRTRLTKMHGVRLTTLAAEQADIHLPQAARELLYSGGSRNGDLGNEAGQKGRQRPRKTATDVPRGLDLGELDPGLLGIIDKAVAMRAQLFLTGQPWSPSSSSSSSGMDVQERACAKESSFTKQISEARRAALSYGESPELWNAVQYWSRSPA